MAKNHSKTKVNKSNKNSLQWNPTMRKVIKLTFLLLLSTQLISCVKIFDLTPKYSKESKTVTLDEFSITPIDYYRKKVSYIGERNSTHMKTEVFKSYSHTCGQFSVTAISAPTEYYFINNMYEDILDQHDGNCVVEKVNNVYFMKCEETMSVELKEYYKSLPEFKKFAYFISNATNVSEINKKIAISLPNASCMDEIKNHFLNSGQPKNIETYNPSSKKWSTATKSSTK
ncbi:MAG: hypothetical protein RPU43_15265 [Candidatus Sedimenticola sp. (ex Thyasira tokunagai)]